MKDSLYILNRKMLFKELEPLWSDLSNINYAVVKGEVLSQQIYGNPNNRISSDIDILVDKKNIHLLETKLQKLGFKQKNSNNKKENRMHQILCLAFSHQIPSYHKKKFGINLNVDINYEIFWGEYEGRRFSIDEFLNDNVDMSVYGYVVKTLKIEKAFIQLVLHHYKEMNSLYILSRYNCIRTKMFKDIYDMVIINKEVLTIKKVRDICERYTIGSIVYYMLYYTNQVFNDSYIEKYLAELEIFRDDMLLESYGLCESERKRWECLFEERLDCDDIWDKISDKMEAADLHKIEINSSVF